MFGSLQFPVMWLRRRTQVKVHLGVNECSTCKSLIHVQDQTNQLGNESLGGLIVLKRESHSFCVIEKLAGSLPFSTLINFKTIHYLLGV